LSLEDSEDSESTVMPEVRLWQALVPCDEVGTQTAKALWWGQPFLAKREALGYFFTIISISSISRNGGPNLNICISNLLGFQLNIISSVKIPRKT
jgi:hypothetical protein